MKAVTITEQGDPVSPNVELTEHDDLPELDSHEVRVKTLASALNHLDLWVGKGVPGLSLEYPRVSGCDACGEVVEVGDEVDPSWVGRRVILNAAMDVPDVELPDAPPGTSLAPNYELIGEHTTPGTHAEFFTAPVEQLAAVADDADPVPAAAFGLATLTAYCMLRTKADLQPGQSVLITGIGGGVALASLAIAKHLGCPAIVTSRHRWKLDKAVGLGADHAVLDEGGDWSRSVRTFTGKRGVDVAIDSIGKATHLWCIKSLARGGAYVTPGCTTGPDAMTDLARVFWNQLRILGSTMGGIEEFREVTALFNAGWIDPVVDSVHTPAEGRAAFERLESGEQFGKVVIDWR